MLAVVRRRRRRGRRMGKHGDVVVDVVQKDYDCEVI